MQWWAWIAVGAILLGSELTLVNAQFYLVFLGISAFIVGLLAVGGVLGAPWLQWMVFAALSVVSMFTFRRQLYARLHHAMPAMRAGPAGETLTMPAQLLPGDSARMEFRGSSWNVVNGGKSIIEAGGAARIVRVDGLTLVVHANPPKP